MNSPPGPDVGAWIDALTKRHTADLTRAELLRAIRALSARYVERRADLPRRSALDSAGKRAAFAVFYAPLHFLTVSAIVERLHDGGAPPTRLIDLGCGTGVGSAAWALAATGANTNGARLAGIDRDAWALAEARWNWNALHLAGSTTRGDMVAAARASRPPKDRSWAGTGIVLAWSANEIDDAARARLLAALLDRQRDGAAVLVVEPIARRAAPWWDEWRRRVAAAGGRDDDWSLDVSLPPALSALDRDAGFDRPSLTARTLFLPPAA